jgi:2-C-methyl-D-erythritol 4-phosphate cytidylyltransferase/2-C-methyl-D-erythritol 2,4-cyclodiphosphate synthase
MDSCARWAAVITAAGYGQRYGAGVPKQFSLLRGKPVLQWSVDVLSALMPVTVTVPPGFPWREYWSPPSGVTVIEGGARRQDSVLAALRSLPGPRFVLVHDGARPAISPGIASRVMRATEEHGAAVPGIRVRDTLKKVRNSFISASVDRDDLWTIQTPQGFRYDQLLTALDMAPDVTDESSAVEFTGARVAVVPGDPRNQKLTEPDDILLFRPGPEYSFGQGLDFHPFSDERPMIAAGCRLGKTGGPAGHSDGDAVLHSAADALLAAASLGDIGVFHPPSDPAWKDADSALILAGCMERVRRAGWSLRRLDLTLIGNRPRVAEHREEMIERVAAILDVPPQKVWIKGTTTNTLGDLGRGGGFGCLALAVLES